jgi:hypothetical protein
MKDEGGQRGRRVGAWFVLLTSSLACGCSKGEWFPEAHGPPKGDERLYYGANNHVYTRSPEEVDAADAALRERKRQQDRPDDARE